jgi:hypothetical protein
MKLRPSPAHRLGSLRRTAIGLALLFAAVPTAALAAPKRPALHGSIGLMERMVAKGARVPTAHRGGAKIPVTITLDHDADATDIATLEALGVDIARDGGTVLGEGSTLAAEIAPGTASSLEGVAHVTRVALDGPVLPPPRPLDWTTELTGAQATWADLSSAMPITGEG